MAGGPKPHPTPQSRVRITAVQQNLAGDPPRRGCLGFCPGARVLDGPARRRNCHWQSRSRISEVASRLSSGPVTPSAGLASAHFTRKMNQVPLAMRLPTQPATMRSVVPSSSMPRLLSLVRGQEATDASLAQALIDGESWAEAETWYRMAPMVLRLAERVLGSRSEAEDLTQEVFVRVFRKASSLRDPASLRSFVYSFAIRVLSTELRKRKLRAWLPIERVADPLDQAMDFESRDLLRRLHALFDRLSTRDRLVFILRRMEAMTVEEIATHLELSPSTVKRSLAYATERLERWVDSDPGLIEWLASSRRAR